jgi:hypothetical protein
VDRFLQTEARLPWNQGFIAGKEHLFVFFSIASKLALGPTQRSIQLVPGALSPGTKRPEREVDHSL